MLPLQLYVMSEESFLDLAKLPKFLICYGRGVRMELSLLCYYLIFVILLSPKSDLFSFFVVRWHDS